MRREAGQFRTASRELGERLAQFGHTVIVGGMAEHTADLHIVGGYVDFATRHDRRGCIQVIRPNDGVAAYEEHASRTPELFEFLPTERWWGAAHLASIREADVIITIGGSKGTYIAGLAAILARKRVIPIATFGGASEEILRTLTSSLDSGVGEFHKLSGPWTPHLLSTVSRLAGFESKPRILIIHGRSNDYLDLKDWLTSEANIKDAVVMGQEFVAGAALPEKFEQLASRVDCAIAVASADDHGGLIGAEELQKRARQNVWLEIGWFWGRLGRPRIMVLAAAGIEVPSDLQGIELFAYSSRPRERSEELRKFLGTVGPI